MPHVEQSIEIQASVDKVFNFIADQPERMAEWWPPIELQERVTPPPTAVGSVSRYTYNMMGIKIKGEHEVIEMTRDKHLHVKTTSGIDSGFDFHFSPTDGGTNLTISVDYELPGSVIGKLLNKVAIEGRNVEDLRHGLENLKRMIENNE